MAKTATLTGVIRLPNFGDGTRVQAPPFPEDLLAVDTETTGFSCWRGARAFAIVLCDTQGRHLYARIEESCQHILQEILDAGLETKRAPDFPGEGQGPAWEKVQAADWRFSGDLPCEEGVWSLEALQRLLAGSRPKVFHNAKFDLRMFFWTFGWTVGGDIHDTLLMARLMMPSKRGLGLKILGDEVLKMPAHEERRVKIWISENSRRFKKEYGRAYNYMDIPDILMAPYAAGDVYRTMLLFRRWWVSCHDQRWELYKTEMALMFELMSMEDFGMRLDMDYVKEKYVETDARVHKLDNEIWEIVGCQFNVGSPPQVAENVLVGMGLRAKISPKVWREHRKVFITKAKKISTNREALKLYEKHDKTGVCRKIMIRGMLSGMASFYKNLIENSVVNSKDVWIAHPEILQHTATTGRFSVIEPPLQTVPSQSSGRLIDFPMDDIPDIRRSFIPNFDTWNMYSWDYSQIELRLIAYYAQEIAMIRTFAEGRDIHDETTRTVWTGRRDLSDADIWKRCRTFCKMVNFGLAYGMGAETFHQKSDTPMDVVLKTIKIYNESYPNIQQLMGVVQRKVQKTGYLHSVFGRVFMPPRSKAYVGMNYLIQGTGADIIKIAMVKRAEWARKEFIRLQPLMQVHDEIIDLIHPADDTPDVRRAIAEVMEDFDQFAPIPIKVGCARIIDGWSNKEEVDLAA